MTRHLIYGGLLLIFITSCNSYRRQANSLPVNCKELLRELRYRIIKNDTGGYTFRFEHPVSDTIPQSETLRGMEFIKFSKHVFNDTLCKCDIDYNIITHTIGKPDKKNIYDRYDNFSIIYSLDFGFNCGGNKCPGSSDNSCNSYQFVFNKDGKLIKCFGSIQTFDIEPYYCTSKIREYLKRMEKK